MNGPLPPLSDQQLAQVARKAGFAGESLVTMIAIILAESGGDPDNVGDEHLQSGTWGPSIGLAQIRSLWAHLRTGQPRDADRLDEPAFNLRSAFSISSGGTNFRPWTMWVNRAYLRFVPRARAAAAGAGLPGPGIELPGGVSVGFGGAGDLVAELVEPLTEGLARIALVGVFVAGGVALVAVGAYRAVGSPRPPAVLDPLGLAPASSSGAPA